MVGHPFTNSTPRICANLRSNVTVFSQPIDLPIS